MPSELVYIIPSSNEKILDRWLLKSSIPLMNTEIIPISKESQAVVELNKFLDKITPGDNRWLFFCEEHIKLLEDPTTLLEGKNMDTVFGVVGGGKVSNENDPEVEVFDARNDSAVASNPVESLGQGILIVHASVIAKKSLRFDEKFPDYYMTEFSIQCKESGLTIALLPLNCESRHPSLPTQQVFRGHRFLREKYPSLLPIGTWDGPVTANVLKDIRAHSRLKDKRVYDFVAKTEQLLSTKQEIVKQTHQESQRSDNNRKLDEYEKKLVWIFGGPRSGTTWLATDILNRDGIAVVNESLIGNHIGLLRDDIMLYFQLANGRKDPVFERSIDRESDNEHRFFAKKYEKVWLNSLRTMILERVAAQFDLVKYQCIIMKSPNESHAADIIMRALPNSKLIFLIRDGRDVIDSRSGAFHNPTIKKRPNTPEERRYRITYYSTLWNLHVSIANKAYEAHNPNLKLFLKYEDLRYDSVKQVERIFRFLDIRASDEELNKVVERTKFENVPEDQRGADKNIRKASPGAWRESFNKIEVALMNKIMGENLLKFGYQL